MDEHAGYLIHLKHRLHSVVPNIAKLRNLHILRHLSTFVKSKRRTLAWVKVFNRFRDL